MSETNEPEKPRPFVEIVFEQSQAVQECGSTGDEWFFRMDASSTVRIEGVRISGVMLLHILRHTPEGFYRIWREGETMKAQSLEQQGMPAEIEAWKLELEMRRTKDSV